MSVTNPTIDAGELSKEVVRDLLRGGLQAFADDSNSSLTDPEAPRGDSAPFVVTSWPNVGALFPHIVVSEENVSLEPIDRRHDVWEGTFEAGFQVEATNSTEKFALKDAVRDFVIKNYADNTFQNAGFSDVSIESTTATDWDATSETTGTLITISGIVYVT